MPCSLYWERVRSAPLVACRYEIQCCSLQSPHNTLCMPRICSRYNWSLDHPHLSPSPAQPLAAMNATVSMHLVFLDSTCKWTHKLLVFLRLISLSNMPLKFIRVVADSPFAMLCLLHCFWALTSHSVSARTSFFTESDKASRESQFSKSFSDHK